jgi:hypothetical protein
MSEAKERGAKNEKRRERKLKEVRSIFLAINGSKSFLIFQINNKKLCLSGFYKNQNNTQN